MSVGTLAGMKPKAASGAAPAERTTEGHVFDADPVACTLTHHPDAPTTHYLRCTRCGLERRGPYAEQATPHFYTYLVDGVEVDLGRAPPCAPAKSST